MSESKSKSFEISKRLVWEAYLKVAANKGAAGVDRQSIEEFEQDLKWNLYRLWNRMSSGSYFPPPVRMVEIPKSGGGIRILGVPTVADRIAQTVVAMTLEPLLEPVFHNDSYGYRPGRSALDAVGMTRIRCWKKDWVIDLDIRAFFDSIDHTLLMRAVEHHTDLPWVLLYVRRWLVAPMQHPDGSRAARERGSPQGSAVSPLLANLFLNYAFDAWMARKFPGVPFERYCDDAVVHCVSQAQAVLVRKAIAARMAECGLELHPQKTRIVYCKDKNRSRSYEHESFTFLGYAFRPRLAKSKRGDFFVSFSPGASPDACKRIRQTVRRWRMHRRSDLSFLDLYRMFNGHIAGWVNYYAQFYKSALYPTLRLINEYLVRWAMQKSKKLRYSRRKAWAWLARIAQRFPRLFAHWRLGVLPL